MPNENILTYREVSTKEIFDSPNEFLNDILNALLLEYEQDPFPIPREVVIAQRWIKLSQRDTHIVIKKLCKDGYADFIVDEVEKYYITFEGVKFIHNGGYVTAYKKETQKTRNQNLKDWLIILGSWMAGIGTILLFLVEFLKRLGWVLSINVLTVCFLLGSGTLLGILVAIMLMESNKVRHREQLP